MLLDLLVPPRCLSCAAAGADLCGACRRALPWLADARCEQCALPSGRDGCRGGARCPAAALAFDASWAPVAHDGPARALVIALKFRHARRAAREMAAQIAALAPPGLLDGALLVPVPSHPRRRARRGYDQATLLARAVSKRTGRPAADVLSRGGAETRQMGAGRGERLEHGRIDVVVRRERARLLAGTPVVLVDDVHTTGASFDACARALRAAGATHVSAVSYSRSL